MVAELNPATPLAEHEPLEILVDTDVQVASSAIPRRVVESLRRQLRQLDAAPGSEAPLALLTVREGRHRMPQALLPRLTEACRKQGVPFAVVDRRANVACPPLRSRLRPSEREREVLRRLLLRDSGVVVVEPGPQRALLAAELCARRQQRTLIVTEGESESWCRELRATFGLETPLVAPLRAATAESRIVVGRYRGVLALATSALREGFGLVIFDGVDRVDAVTLMNIVRSVGARYLLGLAGSASRADGLEAPIQLALGGLVDRLEPAAPAPAQAPPRLALRLRASRFAFPAYEGRDQYQALLAALAADRERAQLVVEDVLAEAREGRACIVLSERRDHLELLASLLPESVPAGTLTSAVRPAERARIAAAFEAGELRVLFVSGQIAAEALPAVGAASLVLGFPFAYARKLEPTVRALLQPSAAKGGHDAVRVYDYDDPAIAPLRRAFEKRRAFLERLARELDSAATNERQLALPIER